MSLSHNNFNPKVLGIIGIRSGSKGVPDKNIRDFLGKPLVGWILEKAKKSKYINKLVVSTDSEIYSNIAKKFDAEVPCLRPKEFAENSSPEIDFVKHMLNFLEQRENYRPDIVVRMMATIPLQKTEDIDAAIKILINDKTADSSVVIAEARQHPQKALKIVNDKEGKKKLITYFSDSGREVTPIARQTYEKAYFRANVIACKFEVINKTNSLTGDTVRYHIIPQERAIDIDNEIDFGICEYLLQLHQHEK